MDDAGKMWIFGGDSSNGRGLSEICNFRVQMGEIAKPALAD